MSSPKQKKKPKGQPASEKNNLPIIAPPFYNYDSPGVSEAHKGGPPPPTNVSPMQNGGNESPQHQQQATQPALGGHAPPPGHPQQHHPHAPMHHHGQQPGMHRGPPSMLGDKEKPLGTSGPGLNGPPSAGGHPSMLAGHGGSGYEMSPHGGPHHPQAGHAGAQPLPPPPQHMGQQQLQQGADNLPPKEDLNAYPGHPMQQPQYRGYHDPNLMMSHHDPYGHYRGAPSMGGKPATVGVSGHLSSRGGLPQQQQQRYGMSGMPPGIQPPAQTANGNTGAGGPPQSPQQPHQGPTPTLNSLLQSHPPPNQMPQQQQPPHRGYPPQPNAYDQQQMPPHPHSHGPPPPQTPYCPQTGWVPPPRPYSPQLGGPQQPYRPNNSSRGQSPYSPPSGAPNPGQYPQQQPPTGPLPSGGQPSQQPQGGPAPPPVPAQYSYPQRYPTPPGGPSNHRSPYAPPPHQYSEAVRGWSGPGSGHSPAQSPGPQGGHHPPQSPQQQHPPQSPGGGTGHAPSPSPQPAQSPHPETSGQSSNESCGINTGAGGTSSTNSQAMRPTPSPTGSSGSRSMSPAVGQPPRPASNHSQMGGGNNSLGSAPNSGASANPYPGPIGGQSQHQQPPQGTGGDSPSSRSQTPGGGPQQQQPPMHPGQGGYQSQQHAAGYKMGPNGVPGMQSPYPPAAQSPQQFQQGNYQTRSPYPGYGQPPGNMVPGGHYSNPGRPMPQPPHGQYSPYHQQQGLPQQQHQLQQGNWTAPPQTAAGGGKIPHLPGQSPGPVPPASNTGSGPSQPPPAPPQQQGQPSQGGPSSQRQLNYLKQHLQHKVSSPTPQQQQQQQVGYGNGPGMHPPMGPPSHHMGPPPPNGPTNMGPPTTPQSGVPFSGPHGNVSGHMELMEGTTQDNGLHSTGSNSGSGGGAHGNHPVTSLVTTGPDGSLIDEASQQSTLSNASAASADDPQCVTPKSRKNETSFNPTHLPSATASPSTQGSGHSEDFEMGSPNWNRTPGSPGFSSHTPQENFRPSSATSTKKSDSLGKLYEMDDNPDRKGWLDRLLGFMEEKRTPITACPTISKQPLDLFRLYFLVKERAGYIEVTKSKTWKDIAGMLGIGASSSAAYTLRKHYSKFILGFECQYDRGGADPTQVMQQAEAGTKKKSTKNISVPSPVAGSSNSQDSFPTPGATTATIDGYNNYPAAGGYPANASNEYNAAPNIPRPPSQTNSQSPHPGNAPSSSGDNISVSNPFDDPVGPPRVPYQQSTTPFPPVTRPQGMPYQSGYSQYGPEQYPPGQYPPPPPGNNAQFQPPTSRPLYPPYESDNANSSPTSNDPYRGYGHGPVPPGNYPQGRPYPQQGPPIGSPTASVPQGHQTMPQQAGGPPGAFPSSPQQDYYRPDQNAQPRRHPDFEKQGQPYPYQQRPGLYAWQNNGQYRGSYPPQPGPQQWPSGVQRPPQSGSQPPNWDRYGQQNQQGPYPVAQPQNQSHWGPMGHNAAGPGQNMPGSPNMMRVGPPPQQQHPQRSKPMPMMPVQHSGNKPVQPGQFMAQGSVPTKRDIVFPMDSVEATVPIYFRRKRISKSDIGLVDPWRIFMALRSGLLVESTWALDVINILLFDDSSIQYFGLVHLPGLLNLLLDHFQKSLADMFNSSESETTPPGCVHSKKAIVSAENETVDDESAVKREPGLEKPTGCGSERSAKVDLGCVTEIPDPSQRTVIFRSTTNYTMTSRKGVPVKFNYNSCEEDLFVTDHNRNWDIEGDKDALLRSTTGGDPWTYGSSELNPHEFLMGCFKGEMVNIPFARFMKGKKDSSTTLATTSEIDVKPSATTSEEVSERVTDRSQASDATPAGAKELSSTSADEIRKRLNGPTNKEMDKKKKSTVNGDDETEQEMEIDDDEVDKNLFNLTDSIRDPARVLKRRRMSDYEDECYTRDEASLYLVNESQDCLARRSVGISNILRNLSFVPGNELEFANSSAFLSVLGKLLLIHHTHPVRAQKTRNYDREEDVDFTDSCSSLAAETEWWWDYLVQIRENMLVIAANIAGYMELSRYDEIVSRPVLDGLLHWAVCPSAHGQDPFPTCGPHTQLSPQRLALEALCKLCVTDANVDLVIATPPFSRMEKLCAVLTRHLCRNEEQVLREFSVNLLHYLVAADSAMARTVAMQSPCISYLVAFIEQAEQTALGVANQHGINFLRDNPDSMGTSLDMLRRAAGTLLHLSRHPDNRPLFVQQEQRLLALVMSHILDQQVALIISRVLFQVSRGTGPLLSAGIKTIESLMTGEKSAQPSSIPAKVLERPNGSVFVTPAASSSNAVKSERPDQAAGEMTGAESSADKSSASSTKPLSSSKVSDGVVTGSVNATEVENVTSNKNDTSGDVQNTGTCGKQQIPSTNAATSTPVSGSPPQSNTGGSQMLTSPIVSISS